MKSGLLLPWSVLVGLLFFSSKAEAARATTLILGKSKPEPKIDIPPTAEEEIATVSLAPSVNLSNETTGVGNVTKLTGVPQIDYIYDPNLPRELNGYNLTDYPFYNAVPEDIDFKCDGLHDGFYASVPHKCQVYHHCLFGTRYDFLCANYTAFDQKTFICHFASEVDCKNSPRYFNRNEALYKATTTTTAPPFGLSASGSRRPQPDAAGGRRRRPYRRRKPSYEYYDEYEDLAEDDYYDEASSRRRKRPRPPSGRGDAYDDAEEEGSEGDKALPPSGPNKSVFDRPRIAPKIRRPVPVNERDKYNYSTDPRAIVKEPVVEKKKYEDTESTNRKQTSSKPGDYYESTADGNARHKEADTERDREREPKGEEYELERERERDRDRDERPYRRPPKKRRRPDGLDDEYDDYDDVRRHRNRNRPRYEEYEDYEYDDRPYRRNREQDYRRDYDYDRDRPYRSRESDYDRPPRNRDRLRDDERPTRNRDVERPLRSRDENRPIRARDSDKPKEQDERSRNRNDPKASKNRSRDEERHYYEEDRYRDRGKDTYRDEQKEEDIDRPYKFQEDYDRQTPDDLDKYRNRNRPQESPPRYRDSVDKSSKSRAPAREEFEGRLRAGDQTERPFRGNDRLPPRPASNPKLQLPSEEDVSGSEEQGKPVPATRPSYITKPEPPRKQFADQQGRKSNAFKRPRVPPLTEDSAEQQEKLKGSVPLQKEEFDERPLERPLNEQLPSKFLSSEDLRGTIEQLNEKLQPSAPENQPPRLKVPHEDSVPKEELAPRAPKLPQTATRRRPFLPSRNGNANLPRNLLPVGVKALQAPRGFQALAQKPEDGGQSPPGQEQRYQVPGSAAGVEFRAKVSTAIGVDQPKLTQFFQDAQSSDLDLPEYENSQEPIAADGDYYPEGQKENEKPIQSSPLGQSPQDTSSSHNTQEYDHNQPFRQDINFRPTLKPTDFPQLSVSNPPPPQHLQEDRNLEQTFKNRPLPSAINQQFTQQLAQQFTTKSPLSYPSTPQPQLGPQSFYSENPKFQTAVKVPEPFPYKPTPPNNSFSPAFNAGTHLPVLPARQSPNPEPVRYDSPQRPQGDGHRPLTLRFPPQNENLDDADELDVSINDALQPISTLHPRNVPTGVFLSNWQRGQQQPAGFKRRAYQAAPRPQGEAQEPALGGQKRPEVQQRNAPQQNGQNGYRSATQRQASSIIYQRYVQPPVYHSARSVTNPGNYFAIFTQ